LSEITSTQILQLLADKHASDVFVPECKNGPTQGAKHFRMDAWAMARSWAHPKLTAYEIKVSRADFLKDRKWHEYLACCNEFYFVAPKGLIKLDELHEGVGLVEVAANNKCLRTIQKARYREIDFPSTVFAYIVMCRSGIRNDRGVSDDPMLIRQERVEYWERWLQTSKDASEIGYRVSERVAKYIREVEAQNRKLEGLMKAYEVHREQLRSIGLNPDSEWASHLNQKINQARSSIPAWMIGSLERMEQDVRRIRTELEPPKKETGEAA
jgi:hypothetical protein